MKKNSTNSNTINWLLLLGIMLIATNLRSPLTSVSPLLSQISQDLNLSLTTAGMLTTIPLLAFACFSIVAPLTERKFGVERVLFFSLILLAIGIVIRSLGNQISLFTGTIMIGIAIAHCNVLVPSLVKRDFIAQTGFVTGLYSVTMNVFGALASGFSLPLATKFGLGWQGSLRIWSMTCLVALIVWLPQLKNNTLVKEVVAPTEKKSLFTSPLAWQISLLMGLQSLIFYTIVTWLPQMVVSKGLEIEAAGSMLAVLQIVLVPVSFVISIIAARLKNQVRLSFIGTTTLLTGLIILWLGQSLAFHYLAIILIGIGIGFCFSLAMIFFSLRTQTAAEASQLSGMAQSLGYLLASFGPVVLGGLFEYSTTWTGSFILLIMLALILMCMAAASSKNAYV